jgi:hypothetical protein
MTTSEILTAIDAQIARLQEARDALAGSRVLNKEMPIIVGREVLLPYYEGRMTTHDGMTSSCRAICAEHALSRCAARFISSSVRVHAQRME